MEFVRHGRAVLPIEQGADPEIIQAEIDKHDHYVVARMWAEREDTQRSRQGTPDACFTPRKGRHARH